MKNPLIICCILGILIGYFLGGGNYLTYGMVGGLFVGYLLDKRNRSTANKKITSTTRNETINDSKPENKIPDSDLSTEAKQSLPNQTPDRPIHAIPPEGTPVSPMNDEQADNVIARAREEIAKNKEQNNY